jgi:DTW domain-containing protein YfiP
VACFCHAIKTLNLPFEVQVLIHPLELKRPSSSVFFLQLSGEVMLHTYQRTQLITPDAGDVLLFPQSDDAVPVSFDTNASAYTDIRRLWLLEGTWQEVTKMLAKQPLLAALPRLSVAGDRSRYPFRKNQRSGGLSTAEALLASIDDEYSKQRSTYYDSYLAHAVASMNGHAPC